MTSPHISTAEPSHNAPRLRLVHGPWVLEWVDATAEDGPWRIGDVAPRPYRADLYHSDAGQDVVLPAGSCLTLALTDTPGERLAAMAEDLFQALGTAQLEGSWYATTMQAWIGRTRG